MTIIGLLGGVASGKSTVARMLAEHGAGVLDADRAAHEALDEPEVRSALRRELGEDLFDAAGRLVRRRLAKRVFGPGEDARRARTLLEGLIHPRVRQRLKRRLTEMRAARRAVAVLDIPLLLEAGWGDECDVLLMVETPSDVRAARAAERGWDTDELSRREAAQAPLTEKRARASAAVVNSGDLDDLRRQVAEFCRRRGLG